MRKINNFLEKITYKENYLHSSKIAKEVLFYKIEEIYKGSNLKKKKY